MINLLFSPCNLPLLRHAISNLCLYLICNCKITNKVFESFIQILLKKKIQGVIRWNIFMFLKSAELPMRAIKFLSECQSHCFTKTWFELKTEASIKQRLGKKALNFSGLSVRENPDKTRLTSFSFSDPLWFASLC